MKLKSMFLTKLVIILLGLLALQLYGQDLKYRPVEFDPILKEMKEANEDNRDAILDETEQIHDEQKEKEKWERENRKILAIDWSGIKKPTAPGDFKQIWHFPPTRQYLTGTCWSFSTTSFLESEIQRQYGKKIKMSEMFTVYNEYLYKAQRYLEERGDSFLGQGSEANAVTKVWKNYGVVPRDIYSGVIALDGRFDHSNMFKEIKHYLAWAKEHDYWDQELALNSIRVIMNRYLGQPPQHFIYEGVEYTPKEFLEEVLWLDINDYVALLSTLKYPFYDYCEFDVPDNWWHSNDYYNVPLDDYYNVIETAVKSGYSVLLGGDISEPGIEGSKDAAIIPAFDVPQEMINQESRELRMDNKASTDDHGIHIVGHKKIGKDNWFLIKDSGSGAYRGQFPGYYFYRADYIKMKMMTVMVHKDIVHKVVKEFREE